MENEAIEKPMVLTDKISCADRSVGARQNEPSLSGLRVLIVDDNRHIRQFLSLALTGWGAEVSQAGNGFEALGMFKPGLFELILTDLNMPGMDGWLLAQKVKQRSPETPIVMLTGEFPEVINSMLPESCVDAVLFKPCKLEEIEGTLLNVLEMEPHCISAKNCC